MTEKTLEIQEQEEKQIVPETEVEIARSRRQYIPRVDIYENEDAVFLNVDMPGVGKNSVDITLEKNVLTIKGSADEFESQDYELSYREHGIGDYRRSFSLSDEVDTNGIEAVMKDGVLRLTLPKVEELKPRKIEVNLA